MFFETLLFWTGLCAMIVALGVLFAQPSSSSTTLLKLYFAIDSIWIGFSFSHALEPIPLSELIFTVVELELAVFSIWSFSGFVFAISSEQSGRLKTGVNIVLSATVAGVLGLAVWQLNFSDDPDNVFKFLKHSAVVMVAPGLVWIVNIIVIHHTLNWISEHGANWKGLYLLYTGMLASFIAGAVLGTLMWNYKSMAFLGYYLPVSGVLLTPFILAAVLKYDFPGVDMASIVKNIFDNVDDGIVLSDLNDRIKQMNSAAERLLETTLAEAGGHRVEHIIPGYFEQPGDSRFEIAVTSLKKKFLSVSISSAGLGRRTAGKLLVIHDVTDEHEADALLLQSSGEFENKIKQRVNELSQFEEMKAIGSVAGGIAHDFNNLLAAVIGFASVVKMEMSEGHPAASDISDILKASSGAKKLVHQLLAFSIPGTENKSAVDVVELVKSTVVMIRSSLPAGVTIKINDCGCSVFVMGSEVNLRQALVNLCTNAYQSMENSGSGGCIEISILTEQSKERGFYAGNPVDPALTVEIVVADAGPGMDDEIKKMAFEPFFSTRTDTIGFGLPTVLRIAVEHSGGVFLRSGSLQGCEAGLVLQRLDIKTAEVRDSKSMITGGEHILLIDDEHRMLRTGKRLLGALGYNVTVFDDPAQALREFRKSPGVFDMVITDYNMPVINGIDLAVKIFEERINTPLILISGNIGNEELERAKEAGIRAFARKPFEVDDIAARIRRLLSDEDRISFSS